MNNLINLDKKIYPAILRNVEKQDGRYKLEYVSKTINSDINSLIYNNSSKSDMVAWLYIKDENINKFSLDINKVGTIKDLENNSLSLYVSVLDIVDWEEKDLKYFQNYSVQYDNKILTVNGYAVKRIKRVEGIPRFRRIEGKVDTIPENKSKFKVGGKSFTYNKIKSFIESNSVI